MAVCGQCGQENPEIARFCLACGSPLATAERRQERKVVTVLFADLVGFTSRAERLDPEDVRAMLEPYHARLKQELEHFGGTVEKFIGDAVMALFGAPAAHEDDPERAVRAALAIQAAIAELNEQEPGRDLHVRIGVTTGEALVTLGARPSEGEGMAAGDVVNTAARLQAAAPVNGILVDATTQRVTVERIEYREHAAVPAKGKSEPVPVWEAVAARSSFGLDVVHDAPTPLVGRDRELAVLVDALARTRAEREPQLVTLIGVPGIGKTRLVWELFRIVDADPDLITWRQGRCLPYGDGAAFWALGEMIKAEVGLLETDTAAAAGTKLDAMLAPLLPAAERGWAVAHIRPLLGLPGERAAGQTEAFAAWRQVLEALADRRPLVLVFEDVHWADEGLLDFVDHLVDWVSGVPLLVVCTARPELLERRPAWGGGKLNAATLALSPLAGDDAARLVSALLEQAVLPAPLQSALLDRAEGNPLYAEQYVRMLTDRGLLVRDARGWQFAPAAQLPLPETLQGIIAARLDGLPSEQKLLLQDAAVLGKVFWLGALAAVGGRGPAELQVDLHGLERTGFVRRQRRTSVADEPEYAFAHALVRDVAYGQIPRLERADRHRRAAAWVESLGVERVEDRAQIAAHHSLQALELVRAAGGDDPELASRARAALVEAAERAERLSAREAAADLFTQALSLTAPDDPRRPHLRYRRGKAAAGFGDLDADADLAGAAEALLAAGEVEAAADAELARSHYYWNRGEVAESGRHLRRALELVEGRPPSPLQAEIVGGVALREMLLENLELAAALARRELELAEALDLPRVRANALITIGTMDGVGSGGRDVDLLGQGLDLARALNDAELIVRGGKNLASVLFDGGRLGEGESLTRRALRDARQFGDGYNVGWFEVELMGYGLVRGEWDEVERLGRGFLDWLAAKRHYMEHACYAYLGRIAAERGRIDEALASSERALELARGTAEPQALLPTLASCTSVLLVADRAADAGALVHEFLELRAGTRATYAIADLAFALVALGSEQAFEPAAQGPWDDAAAAVVRHDFSAAAEAFAAIGSRLHEAHARLHLAAEASAAGDRDRAAREAAAAADFYRRAGARIRLDESEALLRAVAS